jgi:hypothetical protein
LLLLTTCNGPSTGLVRDRPAASTRPERSAVLRAPPPPPPAPAPQDLRAKIKADLGVEVEAGRDFLAFPELVQGVRDDVAKIRASPLVAPGTVVTGAIYQVETGKLVPVDV